jgi:hypothetical protein
MRIFNWWVKLRRHKKLQEKVYPRKHWAGTEAQYEELRTTNKLDLDTAYWILPDVEPMGKQPSDS